MGSLKVRRFRMWAFPDKEAMIVTGIVVGVLGLFGLIGYYSYQHQAQFYCPEGKARIEASGGYFCIDATPALKRETND